MLRGQITDVAAGSIFLFIGLAACSIAVMLRRRGVRIFVWLGIWSAMYGAAQLSQSTAVITAVPRWLQICAPYANAATTYLIVVPASLAFLELSLGWRQGKLERIESNGFLFGIVPEYDYPVCTMTINPGDRFLLYTDASSRPRTAGASSLATSDSKKSFATICGDRRPSSRTNYLPR